MPNTEKMIGCRLSYYDYLLIIVTCRFSFSICILSRNHWMYVVVYFSHIHLCKTIGSTSFYKLIFKSSDTLQLFIFIPNNQIFSFSLFVDFKNSKWEEGLIFSILKGNNLVFSYFFGVYSLHCIFYLQYYAKPNKVDTINSYKVNFYKWNENLWSCRTFRFFNTNYNIRWSSRP